MIKVYFKNNIPYRQIGLISFIISEWCILGDCNQPECHHCFPVRGCKIHNLCIEKGYCKLIEIPKEKLFIIE